MSVFQFKSVLPLQSLCSNHKYRSTNKCRPSTVTTARQFQLKPIFQPQLSALYSHRPPPTTSIGPLQSLPSNHNLSVVNNNYRLLFDSCFVESCLLATIQRGRKQKRKMVCAVFSFSYTSEQSCFTSLNVFVLQMLSHKIIPLSLSTGVFNH